eukprot:scaffold8403_cov52-Phaeocystis_antarctica.AAC.2
MSLWWARSRSSIGSSSSHTGHGSPHALPLIRVFSEPSFFSGPCPAAPTRAHTCPGITQGLCGWLGASGAQDLRALREALEEQPAVVRTRCGAAWMLRQGVACRGAPPSTYRWRGQGE